MATGFGGTGGATGTPIIEIPTYGSLPGTGELNVLYLVLDEGEFYIWTGTVYVITSADNQNASEVPVTPSGNLASTDVQAALLELQGDIDAIPGGSDINAKASATDTTTGFIDDKITVATNKLSKSILNPGGNEVVHLNVGSDIFDKTSDDTDDITEGTNKFVTSAQLTVINNTSNTNTGDQNAAEVSYSNTTSGLTATDVQAAIDELDSTIDALPGGHDALTLNADAPTQESANLIGQELQLVQATSSTDGVMSAEDKTKLDGIASGATVAPVDSVNTQTGAVVLDADDIDDSSTAHKFVTAGDLTILSNTSGTNTGDEPTFGGAGLPGIVPDPITSTGKVLSDAGTWVALGGGGDLLSTNNLSDVANAATARTNLNVDIAGTDNSTNVTLNADAPTQESANLVGQELQLVQATVSTDGVMSSEDKTKLDGVATGANNYVHPNHTGEVTSVADGAQTVHPTAISNKALVTAVTGQEILVNDAGTLKKVDAGDFIGGLPTKAGQTDGILFEGTPKKSAAITFSTPFADNLYTVTITGTQDTRAFTVESVLAGSFVINSNSGSDLDGIVYWVATKHGES